MSIKEIIIGKVNSIDNPEILNSILSLISTESEMEKIYQFSAEEKALVEEGIKDADTGNIYTQEQSDNMISKWLQEKSGGLLEH
jgi:aryl-alcohol dehydrogenase-like predicted oxidoreductase